MLIKTYGPPQTNQFKRFVIIADNMDESEKLYDFARTLSLVDSIDYVSAGLGMYFSRDEDRTFFLLAYESR